jgi:hypothetical protein
LHLLELVESQQPLVKSLVEQEREPPLLVPRGLRLRLGKGLV